MEKRMISMEKQSVFVKIKNFFYNMFHKTKEENVNIQNFSEKEIDESNFSEDIKVDLDFSEITKGIEIEEFLKKIKEDDAVLEDLSIDRLKKLEKFYEDRVNKKKDILRKLKLDS